LRWHKMGHEKQDLQIRFGKGGNFPGSDLPVLYPGAGRSQIMISSGVK
jgi:hypothetical protein